MSVDEGGWRWQIDTLRKQFPGLPLNSGFRNNAVVAGSGNTSLHARGRAVDVPPRMDVFNWLVANYPQSEEIIFTPAGGRQISGGKPHLYSGQTAKDHYSHVHWGIIAQVAPSGGVVSAGFDPLGGVVDAVTGVSQAIAFFTNPGLWARVAIFIAGAFLLLVGLARLAGQKLPSVGKVVKNVRRSGSN